MIAVLDHFQVQHDAWLDTLEKFERTFGHAVGPPDTLTVVAERIGGQAHERDRPLPGRVHVMDSPAPRIMPSS